MTDRELMQQALDALVSCTYDEEGYCLNPDNEDAIDALRARLAQPEPEPVAWMETEKYTDDGKTFEQTIVRAYNSGRGVPLYTAPPLQPEPEPVAWAHWDAPYGSEEPLSLVIEYKKPQGWKTESANWFPLYTAPSRKEWQGLTDEEINKAWDSTNKQRWVNGFARAIEAKLKEKNETYK